MQTSIAIIIFLLCLPCIAFVVMTITYFLCRINFTKPFDLYLDWLEKKFGRL